MRTTPCHARPCTHPLTHPPTHPPIRSQEAVAGKDRAAAALVASAAADCESLLSAKEAQYRQEIAVMKATAESYRQKASELEAVQGAASGGMGYLEAAARAAWAIAEKEAQLNEAAQAARRLREAAAGAAQHLLAQEAAYKEARMRSFFRSALACNFPRVSRLGPRQMC